MYNSRQHVILRLRFGYLVWSRQKISISLFDVLPHVCGKLLRRIVSSFVLLATRTSGDHATSVNYRVGNEASLLYCQYD